MIGSRLKLFLGISFIILMIPLVGMQFSNEVAWSIFDFVVAGILLFSTAFLLDLILKKAKNSRFKYGLVIVLFLCLFLIWGELAVGIFGSPFAGN